MIYLSAENIRQSLANRTPRPLGEYHHYSVLVLLVEQKEEHHLLFTKRSPDLLHQPSDVSFPGGRHENEESYLETALRETWEEIGIKKDFITILGQTDYLVTAAGAIITPFMGIIKESTLRQISCNKDEVAEVFTVPLSFFQCTAPHVHYLSLLPSPPSDFPYGKIVGGEDYPFATPRVPTYFYEYDNHVIWGITARISHHVSELLFP